MTIGNVITDNLLSSCLICSQSHIVVTTDTAVIDATCHGSLFPNNEFTCFVAPLNKSRNLIIFLSRKNRLLIWPRTIWSEFCLCQRGFGVGWFALISGWFIRRMIIINDISLGFVLWLSFGTLISLYVAHNSQIINKTSAHRCFGMYTVYGKRQSDLALKCQSRVRQPPNMIHSPVQALNSRMSRHSVRIFLVVQTNKSRTLDYFLPGQHCNGVFLIFQQVSYRTHSNTCWSSKMPCKNRFVVQFRFWYFEYLHTTTRNYLIVISV